jgi:hypothetical protein
MKQIIIILMLLTALFSLLVYCEDKPTEPPPADKPGYYYPRNVNYGWRYIQLKPGCTEPFDSFDYKIIGTNVRNGNPGYDRVFEYKGVVSADTYFIYQERDVIYEKNVPKGAPLLKVLVGPIKAGTSWKDGHWDYLILGLEDVTLAINGITYKGCAKILKTKDSASTKVYEWWAPQYGKVKVMEMYLPDSCKYAEELRSFTTKGYFP